MTTLGLLAFGGTYHSGASASDPVVEIWECTLAAEILNDDVFQQSYCDDLSVLIGEWFTSGDAHIASTAFLDYVKWNKFDLATGRQVTDPTLITFFTDTNGNNSSDQPLTTTYRISLDDATRNQRHKGGFYPPRSAYTVQGDGRVGATAAGQMLNAAQTLVEGINALSGDNIKVAVWSRRDHATHVVSRIRVGDIPDNIRRRKNAMHEGYATALLA